MPEYTPAFPRSPTVSWERSNRDAGSISTYSMTCIAGVFRSPGEEVAWRLRQSHFSSAEVTRWISGKIGLFNLVQHSSSYNLLLLH